MSYSTENVQREFCNFQEMEITGEVPDDFPLEDGESPPQARKRVGTAFSLPENVLAKVRGTEVCFTRLSCTVFLFWLRSVILWSVENASTFDMDLRTRNIYSARIGQGAHFSPIIISLTVTRPAFRWDDSSVGIGIWDTASDSQRRSTLTQWVLQKRPSTTTTTKLPCHAEKA